MRTNLKPPIAPHTTLLDPSPSSFSNQSPVLGTPHPGIISLTNPFSFGTVENAVPTLLFWLLAVSLAIGMSKINWRSIWFDPAWRHQLTNAVITAVVLGCVGLIGTAIFLIMKSNHWPLAWFLIGGASLGPLLGLCLWIIVSNEKPETKEIVPDERELPVPPIAVTQINVLSVEIGKPIRVLIEINNTTAGIKLRGSCNITVAVGDELAFTPEKRQQNEQKVWAQYEKTARERVPILLTGAAGLMTVPVDGPVATKENVDILNSPHGVLYIAGQIDYGTGALDYCGYIRITEQQATLCVEHNGPSPRPVFK